MKAVILAGGKSTRLYPFTAALPKPLVPVGNWAILEILLMQLRAAGITDVTMAVNHLAHLIESFFGDGRKWALRINYSMEERPLGTVAPIKLVRDLPETFFVMNGDLMTDLDFRELYAYHQESGADITVALYRRQAKIDFGVIDTDASGRVTGFREKPVYNFGVSMGIYVMNRRLLDIVPEDIPFGFDDLMLACIENGRKAICYRHQGYWLDIGRPDDYAKAQREIDDFIKSVLPAYSCANS